MDDDRQGTVDRDIDRDSGEKVWKGCLTGSDDNYLLTSEAGEKFRLHSDKDLNEHVNNMVEVKGSIDADRASDDQQQVGVATEAGAEISVKEVNVNDIKTVSPGCDQASAGSMGQTESEDSAALGMAGAQPDAAGEQPATAGQPAVTSDQSAAAGQTSEQPCPPGETAEEHAAHAGSATAGQSAQAGTAADQSAQAGIAGQPDDAGAGQEQDARVESDVDADDDREGRVEGDIDRDSGEKVWKGCLTGSDDNYLLTSEAGEKFRLHSDKDINEHVNNMVEVKGSIDADRASDDQQRVGVAAEAGAEISVKEVNVNDIKTVSPGCANQNATENDDNN